MTSFVASFIDVLVNVLFDRSSALGVDWAWQLAKRQLICMIERVYLNNDPPLTKRAMFFTRFFYQ